MSPDFSSLFINPDLLNVSLAAKLALVVVGPAVVHDDALRVHLQPFEKAFPCIDRAARI